MHRGRVFAVFNLVDISVVVAGTDGKFFLADVARFAKFFEMLAQLVSKQSFFFTSGGNLLIVFWFHLRLIKYP